MIEAHVIRIRLDMIVVVIGVVVTRAETLIAVLVHRSYCVAVLVDSCDH